MNMKILLNAATRMAVTALLLSSSALASAAPAAPAAAPATVNAAAAALPDADPAMWVVKDDDTTIYLFGTFHVGDGKADWFNDEVKTAFDQSREVYLEAVLPEDPKTMMPLVQQYALDKSGKTLTEKLSPAGRAKLAKLLGAMGAPATALDTFTPMFAMMNLVMVPYQALGMTPEHGTEKKLTAAAKSSGKPVGELEGFEAQLKMLGRIPEKAQIAAFEEMLATFEEAPALIKRMVTYWNGGDAEGFATLMKEMQASSPEVYKVMMTDRNAEWAKWIDTRLDKPGTVFVAVGTAHLAGADSVQKLLADRGIKSARAN
jgi:uncharacterized protein YbaP (TraB family)